MWMDIASRCAYTSGWIGKMDVPTQVRARQRITIAFAMWGQATCECGGVDDEVRVIAISLHQRIGQHQAALRICTQETLNRIGLLTRMLQSLEAPASLADEPVEVEVDGRKLYTCTFYVYVLSIIISCVLPVVMTSVVSPLRALMMSPLR